MASIFTENEKNALASLLSVVHDTWARPIVIYQEAQRTVVSSDPNYNSFYKRQSKSSNIEITPVKNIVSARIQYGTNQEYDAVTDAALDFQTKVNLPIGWVRLKVEKDGYELLKDCKRVEFDERTFTVLSSNRPHGLFVNNYYTFLLQPLKAES